MASTYSNLKIQLMTTGENSTTWGNVTNVNLGTALEEAIAGSADVAFSNAAVTLTLTDTNATQTARNVRLNLTGTATSGYNLIVPAIEKPYIINNGTDGTITVKNATGTGIAVPTGKTMWVFNNGTNVVDVSTHLTSLTTTGNAAIGGTLSTGANLTIGGGGDLLISSATGGNNSSIYNDAQDLYINVNSATRMYISAAGLVGVGTTTPGYPLSVKSAASIGAIRIIGRTADNIGTLEFIDTTQATTQAYIQAGSTPYMAFATSTTERMRIDASGNVGIGTTAPNGPLQIVTGTNNSLIFRGPINLATGGSIYAVNSANSAVTPLEFAASVFYFTGGNVGIGTSTPSTPLQVTGTVTATTFAGAGTSLTGTAASLTAGTANALNVSNSYTVAELNSTGIVYATTPNSATTGGFVLRGNATSGNAILQVRDSTGVSQWGYAIVTSAGTFTWSGAVTGTQFNGSGAGLTGTAASLTVGTATNATNLNSQAASYYTDIPARLGYTPVQQGGGTGQGSSKVYIGWLGSALGLQVDATDFSSTWPINVTGTAATATTATTATTANALNTSNNYQVNSLGVGTAGSGTAGEIRATNNVTAYYSSDARLKENVQPIQNALGIVSAVGGKTFDWTDEYIAEHGGEDGYFVQKSDFGVIAQDVQTVFPTAVREREDGTLAVDYEKLVAVAFQAIAELRAEVEALKK